MKNSYSSYKSHKIVKTLLISVATLILSVGAFTGGIMVRKAQFDAEKRKDFDATAFKYFGKKISYKKVFENIDKVAKSFKALGVKKGDIITMAMPTSPEMVYVFYALNKIGAITNAIDPRLKQDEIMRIMKETNSKKMVGIDIFLKEYGDYLYGT